MTAWQIIFWVAIGLIALISAYLVKQHADRNKPPDERIGMLVGILLGSIILALRKFWWVLGVIAFSFVTYKAWAQLPKGGHYDRVQGAAADHMIESLGTGQVSIMLVLVFVFAIAAGVTYVLYNRNKDLVEELVKMKEGGDNNTSMTKAEFILYQKANDNSHEHLEKHVERVEKNVEKVEKRVSVVESDVKIISADVKKILAMLGGLEEGVKGISKIESALVRAHKRIDDLGKK